ncbi:M28 family metallopeptidase [Paradesulfitobacterium ferrireducens]|uniref:M28 family metallopeptidase n=1 Tax=Paradesulfitobacterium ferrireducens TaxID=2816476 RepID=UPI001A8E4CEA|nr:M20/M25/M40 family metallo-hydrolase [Paradesulfitobacterium ferrireducens]
MQTRRAFIKLLCGLGAVALPWTGLPRRLQGSLESWAVRPPVKFVRLPAEEELDLKGLVAAHLERTAWDDVNFLTSPDLGGRRAGSVGEGKAAGYLIQEMAGLGLVPMGSPKQDGKPGFAHAFTIPEAAATVVERRLVLRPQAGLKIPALNLLGAVPGERAQEIIMICAHYDHLGIYQGKLYPGANDNASGVGCVLEVMRRLVREEIKPKRTVVAAFWSAEEMGFLGSQAFVENPRFPLERLVAVFNVDTVGNGPAGDFMLWADGLNSAAKVMADAAAQAGASASLGPTNGHNSDHISFARKGIPAVTLLSRSWLVKNHTPEDDANLLNRDQLKLAAEVLYRAVKTAAFR